jgi:hypothetical protein
MGSRQIYGSLFGLKVAQGNPVRTVRLALRERLPQTNDEC